MLSHDRILIYPRLRDAGKSDGEPTLSAIDAEPWGSHDWDCPNMGWSGGDIGYNNYYKWQYATWRKSPDRNIFEKIMFWDRGLLFYDASNPPKKYRYEQTG